MKLDIKRLVSLSIMCIGGLCVDYSFSNTFSMTSIADCQPGKIEIVNGNIIQSVCLWDTRHSLHLSTITRTATETILDLMLTSNIRNSGFCVWPVGDEKAFRLQDEETKEQYQLQRQAYNTPISLACNRIPNKLSFFYPEKGHEYPLKLIYNRLPATVTNLRLFDEKGLEEVNPLIIKDIQLIRRH